MKGLVLLVVLGLLLGIAPAHANYWEGHEAFRRGDYYTAQKEFLPLAKQGHAAAQFNLGYLYHHGLSLPRDPVEAAKWYRASAEQGRVEAQFSLGTLYETGSGVARDPALAYRWYNLAASNVPPGLSHDRLIQHRERIFSQLGEDQRRAVEAAPAPAGFALGVNPGAAEPLAATPSVADVQRELAARSFNPGAIDGNMGRSTVGALSAFQASSGLEVTSEVDPPTLKKLFGPEEVAPHLEPFPRPVLARKEPSPPAVPVPPVEAIDLAPYERPAELAEAPAVGPSVPDDAASPDAAARQELAGGRGDSGDNSDSRDAGGDGDGGGGDISEAERQRRLAEHGDADAQISLATMYHYGQGVKEDHEEAVKWYGRAARQGRVDALFPLGSIYEARAGGPQDLVEAYRWYSLAADLVPAGKAREIIVERRDRVALRLSPDQLPPDQFPTVGAKAAPADGADGVALRNQPVQASPPNRPPTELVFRSPSGTTPAGPLVAENTAGGTVLGTLSATDPDNGDVLTFALSEDAGGRFAIHPETGALAVADGARLDFEEAASHEILVRVTDSGGLNYEKSLTVALSDLNEAPHATAGALVVAENSADGTVLGRIAAFDPDGGANGRLSYALSGEAPIAIDPATGQLTVADGASLDFETTPRFELEATATDGGGLSVSIPVAVTLEDVNEAPGGLKMAVGGRVAEMAVADTVAARVSASDPDVGDRLTYSLAEDAGGRFVIDPATGTIRVAAGADLDFEDVTGRFTIDPETGHVVPSNGRPFDFRDAIGHRLVVRVTDSGGLAHDAAIAIQVTDINEKPWVEASAFSVDENALDGTVVGTVRAGDPDGGLDGKLRYALTEADGGARFVIDPETGRITVAGGADLDFEAQPAFELTVTATDGGGLSGDSLVTVALLDRNEPPEALGMTGGTVAEHAEGGTVVARLLANDPDAGDRLTFSLAEDGGGRFAIDAATGTITVAEGADLDFDRAASHQVGVRVTDAAGLGSSETLRIAVTDENFAPTGVALSNGAVAENAEGGTFVARISASDPDAGEHLSYSLAEDAGGRFAIDAETGRITVSEGARLDHEQEPRHQLRVRVVDSGGLTYEEALAIAVLDVNEAPRLAAGSFILDETAGAGTTVGRLRAWDPDRGANGRLRFTITRDDSGGRFVLDPATGVITVAEGAILDYENRRTFELEVTAADGAGLNDGAAVAITLADSNEPPSGIRLVGGRVPENASRGRYVGQVVAVDLDAGDSLTYGLTEDAGGRFRIDSGTGSITVADGADLDFESAASHRLVVRVTDSGGLTYDGILSIALIDANEAPAANGDPLMVSENAVAGTVVGRLGAADPDAGDRLTYGLSDDAEGRFVIDRKTGTIAVADGANLDFETGPGYEVTAKVTDSGGLGDTVVVAIALADVNEAPSSRVMIDGMVAETAAPGTLAAAVTATDPDAGDRLTYSLSDDAGGRFVIDPGRGLITVADGAALDFDRTAEHEVSVRVTDSGGLSDEQALVIALLDVDESPARKEDLLALQGTGTNGFTTNGFATNGGAPLDRAIDGALHDSFGGDGAANGGLNGALDGKWDGKRDDKLGGNTEASQLAGWVARVQAQLVEAGFDPGPVDGKMGPRTRAAMDEYQQAYKLTDLEQADLLDHMLLRAHFRRGYRLQVKGDLGKSLTEYSEVLRIDPEHFSSYFNRGLIHYAETRYDQAVEDFDKVIDLRPDYAGAYVNRGNAYFRQGLYASAARDYMKAVGMWVSPW